MPPRVSFRTIVIIVFALFISQSVASAQALYYLNNSTVYKVDISPSNGMASANPIEIGYGFAMTDLLAVDPTNNLLYLGGDNEIYEGDLDGGSLGIVNTNQSMEYGDMVYSVTLEKIFSVGKINNNGAYAYDPHIDSEEQLVLSGHGGDSFVAVTIDDANEEIYFMHPIHGIIQTNWQGNVANLKYSIYYAYEPDKIHFDSHNEYLYMSFYDTENDNYVILRTNFEDTVVEVLRSTSRITAMTSNGSTNSFYYATNGGGIFHMDMLSLNTTVMVGGIGNVTSMDFLVDKVKPVVQTLSPSDNSLEVPITTSLWIEFNEPVKKNPWAVADSELSAIRIFNEDDELHATFYINSSDVTTSENSVFINNIPLMDFDREYYVTITGSFIVDLANNMFSGFTDKTSWSFKTMKEVFYSKSSGDWNDLSTWSLTADGQTPTTILPNENSTVFVQTWHTITSSENINVYRLNVLGTLTMREEDNLIIHGGEDVATAGLLNITGSLDLPGKLEVVGDYVDLHHTLSTPFIIPYYTATGGVAARAFNDFVIENTATGLVPVGISGGSVCLAYRPNIASMIISSKTLTGTVSFNWVGTHNPLFMVAREKGAEPFIPEFGSQYSGNVQFGMGQELGDGNYVVYAGSNTTFDLSNLSSGKEYEMDVYSYSTVGGGCYSTKNSITVPFSACLNETPANVGGNKSVCGLGEEIELEASSPPTGHYIGWFDSAIGNTYAIGEVGASTNLFKPEITTEGSYSYWAAYMDYDGYCQSPLREVSVVVHPPLVIGAFEEETLSCSSNMSLLAGSVQGGDGVYSYQWQFSATDSGPFQDIGSGGNSAVYTASGLSSGFYRRIVRSASNVCEHIGEPISLTIGTAPTILAQPVNDTVCGDEQAQFTVSAGGSNVTYQWYNSNDEALENNTTYAGVTTSTLSISDASTVSSLTFFCEIKSEEGCPIKSQSVSLSYVDAVVLQGTPSDDILICDATIPTIIAETAQGGTGSFLYQWQSATSSNGIFTDISGAVSESYTLTTVSGTMYYKRKVTSGACSVLGNAVKVSVGTPPAILIQPTDQSICASDMGTILTVTESNPLHEFQWYIYDEEGDHQMITGSPYAEFNSYELLIFDVEGLDGTKYFARVGINGCYSETNVVTLNVTEKVVISDTPAEEAVCDNNMPTLTGGTISGGTGSYTYQWYSFGFMGDMHNVITGATELTYTPPTITTDTYYRLEVKSGACIIMADPTKVIVDGISPIITMHPSAEVYCEEETASYHVQASGNSLTYKWYSMRDGIETLLSTVPYTGYNTNSLTVDNVSVDLSATQYFCSIAEAGGCTVRSNPALLTVHAKIQVNNLNSDSQTICSGENFPFLEGGAVSGGSGTYIYQWESSTSSSGPFSSIQGANNSTYSPSGYSSTTYFRRNIESGECSFQGYPLEIVVVAPPIITMNPSNVSRCEGETATFSVMATGSDLAYQWYSFDGGLETPLIGTPYSGFWSNQLNISNSNELAGLEYFCKVSTNGLCELKSASATFTINPLPIVVAQSGTYCETTSGEGSVILNLSDFNESVSGGISNRSVTWYTENDVLIANPVSVSAANNAVFYARITNTQTSCSSRTSKTVTVQGRPTVTPPSQKFICDGEETDLSFTSSLSETTYDWTIVGGSGISGANNGSGSSINQVLRNTTSSLQSITYEILPKVGVCDGDVFQQIVQVDIGLQDYALVGNGDFCTNTPGALLQITGKQANVKYELFFNNTVVSEINPGVASLWFSPQNVAGEYQAVAVTTNNCRKNMGSAMNVTELFAPSGGTIETNEQTLCVGDQIVLVANSFNENPSSYTWTLPSQLQEISRSSNSITVLVNNTGSGDVFVKAINACGESQSINSTVSFNGIPTVSIDAVPRIIMGDEVVFSFTSSETITDVVWRFSDNQVLNTTSPSIIWETPGDYEAIVEVSNAAGCVGSDRLIFVVNNNALNEYSIKNVITPNGDGENDFLTIVDIERFADSEVLLFDRWGNLLFQRKAYQNDWDLRKGSEYLPAGNYVCVVRHEGEVYSRTITVLKGM